MRHAGRKHRLSKKNVRKNLHVHHLLGIFVDIGQIAGKQTWGNDRFVGGSHDDGGYGRCYEAYRFKRKNDTE